MRINFNIFTFAISLLLCFHLPAQTTNYSHAIDWNLINPIYVTVTMQDRFEDIIIAGVFKDTIRIEDTTLISMAQDDGLISKFRYSGEAIWRTTIGGAGIDSIKKICMLQDGYILAAGKFTGNLFTGNTLLNSAGNFDIFLIKIRATDGVIVNAIRAGGISEDNISGVSTDQNGNIYLSGNYNSQFTIGNLTIHSSGNRDAFLIKLNSNFIPQWYVSPSGTGDEHIYSHETEKNGNSYIFGKSNSNLIYINNIGYSAGNKYKFISKVNSAGQIIWTNSLLFRGELTDIVLDTINNLLLTGFAYDTIKSGNYIHPGSSPGEDAILIKINPAGTLAWIKRHGTPSSGESRALFLKKNESGNIIMCGIYRKTIKINNITLNAGGYTRTFIARLNEDGSINNLFHTAGARSCIPLSLIQRNKTSILTWETDTPNNSLMVLGNHKIEGPINSSMTTVIQLDQNIYTGTLFVDLDKNDKFSYGDIELKNYRGFYGIVNDNNQYIYPQWKKSGYKYYTNNYSFAINGYTSLDKCLDPPYPPFHSGLVNSTGKIYNNYNFAYGENKSHRDYAISLKSGLRPVPGEIMTYHLRTINWGTTDTINKLEFTPDSNLIYIESTILPTAQLNQQLIFDFGKIQACDEQMITLYFRVNPTTTPGTTITSSARILPNDDIVPANNQQWCIDSVIPIKSNPMFTAPDKIIKFNCRPESISSYNIHLEYQNRTKQTARNIILYLTAPKPIIDQCALTGFSHYYSFRRLNDTCLEYRTDEYYLPDSGTHAMQSIGFFEFTVNANNSEVSQLTSKIPSPPIVGIQIAHIELYLDYNKILDTIWKVDYIWCVKNEDLSNEEPLIQIYPNPVEDYFTVKLLQPEFNLGIISLYTVSGKLIMTEPLLKNETSIPTQHLPTGFYILQYEIEGKYLRQKLMIR